MSERKPPRLRSGGQTGVDRAALDAAIHLGLAYEGWCPKGGWAEDLDKPPGLLKKYPFLRETPERRPAQRTNWNVRDGDATLVLVPKSDFHSEGTEYTIECAKEYERPLCVVSYSDGEAAQIIRSFAKRLTESQSLNIAGPRESEHPGAYDASLALLLESLGRKAQIVLRAG